MVWGGDYFAEPSDAPRYASVYDPNTREWRKIETVGGPHERYGHRIIWTGERAVIFGGALNAEDPSNNGIYDPVTGDWVIFPHWPKGVSF